MELKGKITKGRGGIYAVRLVSGENVNSSVRGLFRKNKITPTIGDDVILESSGDPDVPYVITEILPRRSCLIRPPVANVDCLILCFAVTDPEPDLLLLDKMLILCALLKIKPLIVFTKSDLDPSKSEELIRIYSDAGFCVFGSGKDSRIAVSSILDASHEGATFGFAGPSGVGKSTLLNHLLEDDVMSVGHISDRLKRGKHTTRHVELFEFGKGFVMDTPGFTSLSLAELGVEYKSVVLGYPEISRLAVGCRFDDCRHASERECAVIPEVGSSIDKGRYDRYRELEEELYQLRNTYSGRRRFIL